MPRRARGPGAWEFGYWVYEGDLIPGQRPSWKLRREEGGGIDGHALPLAIRARQPVRPGEGISCLTATHIPGTMDEDHRPYACTADDSAYATLSWKGVSSRTSTDPGTYGCATTISSPCRSTVPWAPRWRECGLLHQPYGATPRPIWNPDLPNPIDFFASWQKVPEQREYDNAFKAQWELFLRHIALDEPFPWNLLEGAKGVQLAEQGLTSSRDRRWVHLPTWRADGKRVARVTGDPGGIGFGCADALAREGWNLAVCGVRPPSGRRAGAAGPAHVWWRGALRPGGHRR